METFFARTDPKFLPPSADRDRVVEAQPFLLAAKQMVPFFDMLGTAFKPIKSDIDGNICKLQKKYNCDPEKFITFEAMLKEEVENKTTKHKESATIALLWLKRALQFTVGFLQLLVEDHNRGDKTENMVSFCKKAYEQTLKQYHGWIVQKVFAVVMHATPWRRDFLKTLAYGHADLDDQVIKDMEEFVGVISENLQVIQELFTKMDLDFPDKV